ncbi:MAG TPA: nuclear transport factor 2 family protein [Chloroflexota bacterium]
MAADTELPDLVALAQRALQLLDERRLDEWEQTMRPDATFIGPGMELHGSGQIRQFVEGFHHAFPDITHRIDRLLVAGDTVIMEGVFSGTHTGVLRTPGGDIPATGKRVEVREAQLVTVDQDGLAIRFETYFDRREMMTQLGLTGR